MSTRLNNRRAVAYFCIPASEKGEAGGGALDSQKEKFRRLCEEIELVPYETYVDILTDDQNERPQYKRMAERVLQGRADVIVVSNFASFGENPGNNLPMFRQLQSSGAYIIALD